jgi:hypothetical protein
MASAVSTGFSRLGTPIRLLEGIREFANPPVERDDLVAKFGDIATGRQVHQVPDASAAPLDEPSGLPLQTQGGGEHGGELRGLDRRLQRRGDAGVDGVVHLSPERLVRHDGLLSPTPAVDGVRTSAYPDVAYVTGPRRSPEQEGNNEPGGAVGAMEVSTIGV